MAHSCLSTWQKRVNATGAFSWSNILIFGWLGNNLKLLKWNSNSTSTFTRMGETQFLTKLIKKLKRSYITSKFLCQGLNFNLKVWSKIWWFWYWELQSLTCKRTPSLSLSHNWHRLVNHSILLVIFVSVNDFVNDIILLLIRSPVLITSINLRKSHKALDSSRFTLCLDATC